MVSRSFAGTSRRRRALLAVLAAVALVATTTTAGAQEPDDGSSPTVPPVTADTTASEPTPSGLPTPTSTTTTGPAPAAESVPGPGAGGADGGSIVPSDDPVEGRYLVTLADHDPTEAPATVATLTDGPDAGIEVLDVYEHALAGFAAEMTEERALELSTDPLVESVEEDGHVRLDDTQTGATWGIDRVDQRDLPLDTTYTYEGTGAGVTAYVIDTGIRTSHQDFGGRARVGADFVGDGRNGQDCNGHGTHVAGTIGGATYGLAKQVDLVAVRVFGCSGGAEWSRIISAVDWVTANATRPAVVNMSLGGSRNATVDTAVANSVATGITYALSAGNDSTDGCNQSPGGGVPTALTVASSTNGDARSSFSNHGPCVDLFAPGSSITSDWYSSDTATNTISGTSMASPHVAGAAAMYLGHRPEATPAEVATAMLDGATTDRLSDARTGTPNKLLHVGFVLARPAIVVSVDARPDAPQDFTFTGCADGLGCDTFSLDDDDDAALPATSAFGGVDPGVYTVTQDAPSGWTLSDLDCGGAATVDLGARRATITLAADQVVTCRFVNDTPTLTVELDTVPDRGTDVGFTGCRTGAGCSTFTLDDDPEGILGRSQTFVGLLPGEYTVTQDAAPDRDLTDLTCDPAESIDLAGRRVTVDLAAGEHVTCTFTTTFRGSLQVVADSDPDHPQDFTYDVCALDGDQCTPVGSPLLLDDDGDPTLPRDSALADLVPGRYRVTQRATAGWGLVGLRCGAGAQVDLAQRTAVVDVGPGEDASCTFTNRLTTVTVVQDSDPDAPQDFTFTGCKDGVACGGFVLDDDTDPALPDRATATGLEPARYTIRQGAVDGWGLVAVSCPGGQVDLAAREVVVDVAAGDQVTCTFTTRATALTIVAVSAPASAQDFTFEHCGPSGPCATHVLDDDDGADATRADRFTLTGLDAGIHDVTEAAVAGWGLPPGSVTCTPSGLPSPASRRATVVLEPGDQRTCTFTNHQTSLTVVHDAGPAVGRDVDYTICAVHEPRCGQLLLDDDQDPGRPDRYTMGGLSPGIYSVHQHTPDGWGLVALSCTSGESDLPSGRAVLVLTEGVQAVCTFDVRETSVTVVHDATRASPQDFDFWGCRTADEACSAFVLDDDGDGTRPDRTAARSLAPGRYRIDQVPVEGWGLVALECSEGDTSLAAARVVLEVEAGDQVTCTFRSSPTILTVRLDVDAPSGQDFVFQGCRASAGQCGSVLLDDDGDPTLASSVTFYAVPEGSYTVSLEDQAGWGIYDITCTEGGVGDVPAARATMEVVGGDEVTCTFFVRDLTRPVFELFRNTGINEPWGIDPGPDGTVWLASHDNDSVGRIDAATGALTLFPATGMNGPNDIRLGPDGNMWASGELSTETVARIDPDTGVVTAFPSTGISDPGQLDVGPDGNLWVAAWTSDSIARVDTATGALTPFSMSPLDYTSRMAAGPDGNLWVSGYNNDMIGRVDPATGVVTAFATPGLDGPWQMATDRHGMIWVVGYTNETVGRVDPATGAITVYPTTGMDTPRGIVAGPDGNLWITGYGNDTIGRLDPDTGTVTAYPAGGLDGPYDITVGPDGNLWATGYVNDSYARIRLPEG